MPIFKTTKRVAVPPDLAFAVASDVASYKEFLPLLQRSTIRGKKVETPDGQRFDAELAVAYPKLGLAEAFVSKVNVDRQARSVRATSQDAPFRAMATEWQITALGEACDVAISIEYSFRNPLLQIAASGVMELAVGKIMAAFEARALQLQRTASASS